MLAPFLEGVSPLDNAQSEKPTSEDWREPRYG